MSGSQTHWKKLHNPNYIGAYALNPGQDLVVKITKVVTEKVKDETGKDESCLVAYLENQKPFILNKTNCKTIEKVTGTAYIEDWAGQYITIFAAKVKAFGDTVEALRIRPTKPVVASKSAPLQPATKEDMTPSHPLWAQVKASVIEGKRTFAQIREKFNLSEENEFIIQAEKA